MAWHGPASSLLLACQPQTSCPPSSWANRNVSPWFRRLRPSPLPWTSGPQHHQSRKLSRALHRQLRWPRSRPRFSPLLPNPLCPNLRRSRRSQWRWLRIAATHQLIRSTRSCSPARNFHPISRAPMPQRRQPSPRQHRWQRPPLRLLSSGLHQFQWLALRQLPRLRLRQHQQLPRLIRWKLLPCRLQKWPRCRCHCRCARAHKFRWQQFRAATSR